MHGGYATTQVGQKVTVEVTIHDGMLNLRPNGAGNSNLRRDLAERFWKIYHQGRINEPDLGRTIKFKFTKHYKLQGDTQQATLGHYKLRY